MRLLPIRSIIFVLLVFAVSACSKKLEKYPKDTIAETGYWKRPEDFRDAANYFYSFLPPISDNYAANWTDDGFATASNAISDGSRTTPATSSDWDNAYKLIRAANTLLEKAAQGRVDGGAIRRYVGEARFFRAWAYFDLVRRFGGVPLFLHTFDVGDPENQAPRNTSEEVLDAIYADLDESVNLLPKTTELSSAEYGRVTRGSALSLKARAGLFAGTRRKFNNEGGWQRHLTLALDAAAAVMSSGEYSLFRYTPRPDSSYYYLFQPAGEGPANRENILVRLYGESTSKNLASHNYSAELTNGFTTPTRSFMDAYLYKDGLPKERSPYYKTPVSTLTEFEDRDPRMGATVFNKTVYYTTNMFMPSMRFSLTGYYTRKYFHTQSANDKAGFTDYILPCYAEVLLTWAEAEFELHESISDEALNKSVNLIRDRAGLPSLTNAFVQSNGLDMRTELRRERRIELAFEGQNRYWDLIRWKTAETELPKTVLGAYFFPTEYGTSIIPVTTSDKIIIVQDASRRRFDPQRDYLWPLPTRDLGLNLNLTQNPGW